MKPLWVVVGGSRQLPPPAGDCPGICWSLSHSHRTGRQAACPNTRHAGSASPCCVRHHPPSPTKAPMPPCRRRSLDLSPRWSIKHSLWKHASRPRAITTTPGAGPTVQQPMQQPMQQPPPRCTRVCGSPHLTPSAQPLRRRAPCPPTYLSSSAASLPEVQPPRPRPRLPQPPRAAADVGLDKQCGTTDE